MSILVDWEIEGLISQGEIGLDPYTASAIQPNSVDVHLSNSFAYYRDNVEPLDPYEEESTLKGCQFITTDEMWLMPGKFLLAETLETLTLPSDICAQIEGKSSWARLGVSIHQTGGWIDCGFTGTLTLEMTNVNIRPVILRCGDPIAQMTFMRTQPSNTPYNHKVGAKYSGQRGATVSRFWKNKP